MEYAKSGSDDQAAAMGDAAFDPDKTSPEEQKKAAGEGDGVSSFRLYLVDVREVAGLSLRWLSVEVVLRFCNGGWNVGGWLLPLVNSENRD